MENIKNLESFQEAAIINLRTLTGTLGKRWKSLALFYIIIINMSCWPLIISQELFLEGIELILLSILKLRLDSL